MVAMVTSRGSRAAALLVVVDWAFDVRVINAPVMDAVAIVAELRRKLRRSLPLGIPFWVVMTGRSGEHAVFAAGEEALSYRRRLVTANSLCSLGTCLENKTGGVDAENRFDLPSCFRNTATHRCQFLVTGRAIFSGLRVVDSRRPIGHSVQRPLEVVARRG